MKIGLSKKCLDYFCVIHVLKTYLLCILYTVVLIFTIYAKLNLIKENKHNFDRHSGS